MKKFLRFVALILLDLITILVVILVFPILFIAISLYVFLSVCEDTLDIIKTFFKRKK